MCAATVSGASAWAGVCWQAKTASGVQGCGYSQAHEGRFSHPKFSGCWCGGTGLSCTSISRNRKWIHVCNILHFGGMAAFGGRQGMAQRAAAIGPLRDVGRHYSVSVYSTHQQPHIAIFLEGGSPVSRLRCSVLVFVHCSGVCPRTCGHAELPQQRMSFFGRSVDMTLAKSPVLHILRVSLAASIELL